MSFNEKLQKLRKANKLSQEQLAEMLDVTRQSVSKWESGYTYPEMDKLLAMCKIFKCTLDDLTNDEITDINIKDKKKNNLNNFIDSFFDLIRGSYEMFKQMSFKEVIKCLLTMFIVGLVLLLLNLPFDGLESAIYGIFDSINNNPIVSFIRGSINLLFDLCYWLLYLLIFIYIFKIAYLDNHDQKEKLTSSNEDKEKEEPKKFKETSTNPVFNGIATIVIAIVKIFVCFFAIPFIISLFFLSACLLIAIVLLFKGVFYLSILLGLIFAILLNVLIIEIIINFIFNHKNNVRRLLITFVVSIVGLGLSSGILMFEISNTTYINKAPDVKISNVTKEITMADDLYFDFHYPIEYVVDNSLESKVKVSIDYYEEYTNAIIEINDKNTTITTESMEQVIFKKIFDIIIKDLADKKIHNYNELGNLKITVYSSESNIEKLKNNTTNYLNERERINEENTYQNELNSLYQKIELLELENSELENKNDELEYKVDEYEEKIANYKENLKSLLSND